MRFILLDNINMSTLQVYHWRIFCSTENIYVDGYLNRTNGTPSVCFHNNTHTIDTARTELVEIIKNNYTPCVIKWNVYCDTESLNVEGYLNSDVTPSKCFNNDTHTITGTPEKLEVIHNEKITIKEESIPIEGRFKVETIKISADPNETKVVDKVWKIDIAPLSVKILSTDKHKGDTLQVDVLPDKVVGVVAQDISISDTVIHLSESIINLLSVGFPCSITDGVNVDNLNQILDIDYVNNTITVETATTNTFLISSPTYLRINIRFLGPHELGEAGSLILGDSKLGASFVPKNEIVRLTYVNNSDLYKDLYTVIEYLY